MDNFDEKDLLDLGSGTDEDVFDPFASEEDDDSTEDTPKQVKEQRSDSTASKPSTSKSSTPKESAIKNEQELNDKLPLFEYAGASEKIDDTSKTFEELRVEKSADFPELEDGKKVSWTVEYGKITKPVADPKGTSIGKMKSDIESSKEFADSLKKPKADKNPTCKIKPRVTAQSKGMTATYRGVFTSMEEAETARKAISIVPSSDGRVYEVRDNAIGKFITPVTECDMLSDIRAGFIPALPLIPEDLLSEIIAFFRYFMRKGMEQEVLVNIYWDTYAEEFVADAPEQFVTKVSVDTQENPDYTNDRYIHAMDIHSHNNMKAFFSAKDDADEKATRLYSVIGRLDKYFPDIKTRISNGGKFLEIDPCKVFALTTKPFKSLWESRVRLKKFDQIDNDILKCCVDGGTL